MKSHLKKIFLGLALALVLVFVTTHFAHAGFWDGIYGIVYGVIGRVAITIGYLFAVVLGAAIAIEAWILGIILQIGTQVLNSPPVKFGFPVTLALANLAFVLALIVIAIMTILRQQGYAVKDALWRLIAMAIIINFGLVIAGFVLYFTDNLTVYFLNQISPQGAGFMNFATALAGAFNPQQGLLTQYTPSVQGSGLQNTAFADAGTDLAGLLGPIIGIVFTVLALLFVVIILAALVVMLIVRYVYLGYLLILLPLAWASWVLPVTRNQWSKWWTNFIKQAFFAPIVVFFLWVSIMTSYALSRNSGGIELAQIGGVTDWGSAGPLDAVKNFIGGAAGQLVKMLLNEAILLGLMTGGIFAAQSMGVTGAKMAVAGVNGVSKSFGNWAARKGRTMGTSGLRTEWGKNVAKDLQTRKYSRLARGFGVAAVGKRLGGAMQAGEVVGGEKAIADASKRQASMTNKQLAYGLSRMSADERIAAIGRLQKENALGELSAEQKMEFLGEKNKDVFNRYGQGLAYDTMAHESGVKLNEVMSSGDTGKIREYFSGMENGGSVAKNFMMSKEEFVKKGRDGKLPPGVQWNKELNEDLPEGASKEERDARDTAVNAAYATLQGKQREIMENFAKHGSVQAVSTFQQAGAKKGQASAIRLAAEQIDWNSLSDDLKEYYESTAAKSAGFGAHMWKNGPARGEGRQSDKLIVEGNKYGDSRKQAAATMPTEGGKTEGKKLVSLT